ncbi:Hsp20/alpha crystallin family protein [Streptomyces sp. NPDC085931]|uniref:Hsp20/alpha crystallin family protein n=1 Tax=Streptomyces sp. NPDC085931 TaxID=3365740 RepID=UPI0037CFD428
MLVRTGVPGDLDRMARQLARSATAGTVIPADVWRDDDAFFVQFDLPGMDRSSIEVTVERGTLLLSAERPSPVPAGARPVLTERPTGRFSRRLTLSDALDADAAQAVYDNGVLTLRIPLAAHAKPRKIAISQGEPKQVTS